MAGSATTSPWTTAAAPRSFAGAAWTMKTTTPRVSRAASAVARSSAARRCRPRPGPRWCTSRHRARPRASADDDATAPTTPCHPAVLRGGAQPSIEADLAGAGDRLGARGRVELAVDRVRLGLDRVGRDVQARGDLPEGQVAGEEAQDAQLRRGQGRRAARRRRPRRCPRAPTCRRSRRGPRSSPARPAAPARPRRAGRARRRRRSGAARPGRATTRTSASNQGEPSPTASSRRRASSAAARAASTGPSWASAKAETAKASAEPRLVGEAGPGDLVAGAGGQSDAGVPVAALEGQDASSAPGRGPGGSAPPARRSARPRRGARPPRRGRRAGAARPPPGSRRPRTTRCRARPSTARPGGVARGLRDALAPDRRADGQHRPDDLRRRGAGRGVQGPLRAASQRSATSRSPRGDARGRGGERQDRARRDLLLVQAVQPALDRAGRALAGERRHGAPAAGSPPGRRRRP